MSLVTLHNGVELRMVPLLFYDEFGKRRPIKTNFCRCGALFHLNPSPEGKPSTFTITLNLFTNCKHWHIALALKLNSKVLKQLTSPDVCTLGPYNVMRQN